MSFWKIMFGSIPDNWYILTAVGLEIFCFVIARTGAKNIKKNFKENGGLKNKDFNYQITEISYTFFVVGISIFPLLGMFGTVKALIGLGSVFEAADTNINSIKSEFFFALTSTAWGIIFSIIFKLVNARYQSDIENQISKAKNYLSEKGTL